LFLWTENICCPHTLTTHKWLYFLMLVIQ
jgi:hypothetical protein